MNFPTYVYQGGVFPKNGRIVKDVKETLLALEDGYWSHEHKKEEIPDLFKAEIKAATQADKDDNVLERFMEKTKSVLTKPKEEIKKPNKGTKNGNK